MTQSNYILNLIQDLHSNPPNYKFGDTGYDLSRKDTKMMRNNNIIFNKNDTL